MSEQEEQKYYTVYVDVLVPATLQYKVLAKSPEEAVEKSKQMNIQQAPSFKFAQMKRLYAKVYDVGTMLLRYSRSF